MECHTCERRTTLGKAYGIKLWYYWEHLEELDRIILGTIKKYLVNKNFFHRLPNLLALIMASNSLVMGMQGR